MMKYDRHEVLKSFFEYNQNFNFIFKLYSNSYLYLYSINTQYSLTTI